MRGGAVVARWAHNPKVGGSNPPSATKKKPGTKYQAFLFSARRPLARRRDGNKKAEAMPSMAGFFFVKLPKEDHERSPPMPKASAGEASNPPFPLQHPRCCLHLNSI
jgi:hypothetical protein